MQTIIISALSSSEHFLRKILVGDTGFTSIGLDRHFLGMDMPFLEPVFHGAHTVDATESDGVIM